MYIPDLLTNELSSARCIFPPAEEEFPKEWVQWFLLAAQLLVPTTVRLLECCEEPFQDE